MRAGLARAWEQWKTVEHSIGNFQARLLLTLFYFIILGPFAMIVRWCDDPLSLKARTPREWCPKTTSESSSMEQAPKQP